MRELSLKIILSKSLILNKGGGLADDSLYALNLKKGEE